MHRSSHSSGSWSHGSRSRRFVQETSGNSQGSGSFFRRGHDNRFVPYGGGQRNNRDKKRRNQKGLNHPKRGDQDQWFKIVIPFGKKAGKDFILKSINELCRAPFVPINFQFNGNAAFFFLNDYLSATAVKELSRKIKTPDGFMMNIIMNRSPPPHTNLDKDVLEHIKTTMSDRYDVHTKKLNLSLFHEDPALKAHGIYAPLQRKALFDACVNVIREHIPDLQFLHLGNNKIFMLEPLNSLVSTCKALRSINLSTNRLASMAELNHIKGMGIEELVLDGNPLCDSYKDQSSYISAVRDRLPKVIKLDGESLPTPIGFDLGTEEELPPLMGSFFPSDDVKQLVVQFLEQYFSIYDSDNRQPLLAAYHDQALFSMALSKNSRGGQYNNYVETSRNFLYVNDNNSRFKLLNQGKLSVVSTLSKLPATQHDPSSFVVDVSYVSPMLMMFTVTGVFKEVPLKDRDYLPLRTFSRTLIVVPQGQGFSIVNETLLITNATVEQVKAHKAATAAVPPAVAAPAIVTGPSTDDKAQLALEMSNLTGMNIAFSARCLEENDWNLQISLGLFRELQSRAAIPAEAFLK